MIHNIALELSLQPKQVQVVKRLLQDDATVPFIARYRKAQTQGLDEEQIRNIQKKLKYYEQLNERKETILKAIELQGKLTPGLKEKITRCTRLTELEDLYLPYKPKRKTKARKAIEQGLEPLAELLLSEKQGNKESILRKFIRNDIATPKEALRGAQYILAERISENPEIRAFARNFLSKNSELQSQKKETEHPDAPKYEIYEDFVQPIHRLKPHQILAINRAEKEKILKVKLLISTTSILEKIRRVFGFTKDLLFAEEVTEAFELGISGYLLPSLEREIRKQLTEFAEKNAIETFAKNLRNLLLQPPIAGHIILGVDPGYASGCKLAVIDKQGKFLESSVIYPTPPKKEMGFAEKEILRLIRKYDVTLIAIGNGTASRETERFVAELLEKYRLDTKYLIVSEAGASVYSASKIAKEEFPELDVTERGTISIARRVLDPLAELVKINPQSLSVGLYQHDINPNALQEELNAVVESVVNEVGVDLNTASYALLSYVSGLNKKNAKNIVRYREENGIFSSREELKNVPGIGEKTFEQAAGFLKVRNSNEPLDNTQIHPESYEKVKKLAKALQTDYKDLQTFGQKLQKLSANKVMKLLREVNLDMETYSLILKNLLAPGRDPREDLPAPILRSDVLSIDDLYEGMQLQGTVRNVVDFGAFVDIGLKNDGLLHISKLGKRVQTPHELLGVGDVIAVEIIGIDKERGRVSLAFKGK